MQSRQTQDLDWNDLLELGNPTASGSFSPTSNRASDRSPAAAPPAPPALRRRAQLRNRNPRSCDFCRLRKTACVVEDGSTCIACGARGLECTFDKQRRARRQEPDQARAGPPPDEQGQSSAALQQDGEEPDVSMGGLQPVGVSPPTDFGLPPWDLASRTPRDGFFQLPDPDAGLNLERGGAYEETFSPQASSDSELKRDTPDQPLDHPSWTYLLLGDSAEADPHLLKHHSLAIHADNLRFRRVYRDQSSAVDGWGDLDLQRPLVFMFGSNSLYQKHEPQVDADVMRSMSAELDRVNAKVAIRLVKLFFKYVYPYFPVVSRSRILQDYGLAEDTVSGFSISLKAALYASSMPYMVYDDVLSTMLDLSLPTADSLYRICWTAITQEIHTPRLSTMQACLLLLQRKNVDRFVPGSPFQWSLMAWTVSLAQTLGLSTDCSTIRGIPSWEKRLRKRLWWATYVLDKWTFALSGLASHIRDEDFDVLPLTSTDFLSDGKGSNVLSPDPSTSSPTHFQRLVELTVTLADTVGAFFTVRASAAMTSDFVSTCQLASGFQSRLESWKASFDQYAASQTHGLASRTRLDGNASLYLGYWAVRLLLVRAMLRPLMATEGTAEDKQLRETHLESVRHDAETCCLEAVDFVERLSPGAWNAFWHKFSPSNFAMVSSIMMRLLVTATSASDISRLNEMIDRWRWILRSGGGNAGGELTSLALLRLDRTLLRRRGRETSVDD